MTHLRMAIETGRKRSSLVNADVGAVCAIASDVVLGWEHLSRYTGT